MLVVLLLRLLLPLLASLLLGAMLKILCLRRVLLTKAARVSLALISLNGSLLNVRIVGTRRYSLS